MVAPTTRILAPLGSARTWLETHNAAVTSLVLAVIGALLLADGASTPCPARRAMSLMSFEDRLSIRQPLAACTRPLTRPP
ncbi:hypothetical protein [Kitasatospora paranensis]|uniref:Uncharacterized protein n=1 Tax=Kitasatospora paranensis TaxID=258053 RepID=A0ABW2GA73_9ACTN